MTATPRAGLPVVLGVVVVDLIGFGIVMPILPFMVEAQVASDQVGIWVGLLLSGYAAAQFVFAPLWGRLSDRIGRRPVMLATIAGTAFSLFLFAWGGSLGWLLATRVLAGAFAANVSVASAFVADATDESERTRWMGLIGAAFGIGFLLGPALAGGLSPLGNRVPLFAAAGLAALNWVHALVRLPETQRHESRVVRSRRSVLADPSVRWLCLANLVFALSVTQLETVFQIFLIQRFHYAAWQVALLMVAMAAVMATVQGGGMKALAARFPERRLVWVGALAMAACFAAVPAIHAIAPLLAVLAISAVGRAVIQPSLLSLTSFSADPADRGAVMGAFQSAASLARVFGPFAAGWLYDHAVATPFWLAGMLAVALSLLASSLPARATATTVSAAPSAGS
ncbi:MAG TPA: MFS transporter [Myxococcota bacterium]|nr:MFS transporter [Myxococcota bacterium]